MPHERLSFLLARVAAGDMEGMAALYDETSPIVFGLLRQVLGAGTAAEEALGEVYICVWRKAATYRAGEVSAFSWLVSTTLECLRRRDRPAAAEVTFPEPSKYFEEADANTRSDGTPDADHVVEAARAREAFGRLDPLQGEALRQTYFHGAGRSEAALGLSTRESRALVSSGLRSYAEMVKGAPAD